MEKSITRKSFEHGLLGQRWRSLYRAGPRNEEEESIARWAQARLGIAVSLLNDRRVPKQGLALEIGCGAGVMASILERRGYEVIASDLSSSMLGAARLRYPGLQTLLVADTESLPLHDASIDLVVCLGVLEYLRDARTALAECYRALREGGTLLVSAVSYLTPAYLATYPWRRVRALLAQPRAAAPQPAPTDGVSVRGYNHFALHRLATRIGFRRLDWKTHDLKLLGYSYLPALNLPLIRYLGGDYVALYGK